MSKGTATPSYRKRLGYHSGLLGGMGLLASVVLVIGNIETHQAIAVAKAADQKASLEQVIPTDLHDNDLLQDTVLIAEPSVEGDDEKGTLIYLARKDQQVVAVAYEQIGYGYAGEITIIMGVSRDGEVLGVRVLSHSETPGLGDRIEAQKSDWILGFNGLSLQNPTESGWQVKKDGGQFDQFTGATITPRAVVKMVKQGLKFFAEHQEFILKQPVPVEDSPSSSGEIEYGTPVTAISRDHAVPVEVSPSSSEELTIEYGTPVTAISRGHD